MINLMTKYSFILLSGEQEAFLAKLQELGVVDITRSAKPVDEPSQAMLSRAENLKKAISLLESAEGEAAPFESADPVGETFAATARIDELRTALAAAEKERDMRLPWGDFDAAALKEIEAEGLLKIRYYSVPKKKFDEAWKEQTPLQVVSDNGTQVYFVTVSDDPQYTFPVEELPAPAGSAAESDAALGTLQEELNAEKRRLAALKGCLPALRQEYQESLAALDLYLAGAASAKAAEDHIVVFQGFAPVENYARLTEEFDSMDLVYLWEPARVEDNPPIKLKNNKFTRMFSVLTDMYGRPVYNEFDPTPYISVFFLLFFAMCMGDAGYGIILMLIGALLKRVKGFADTAPLVITLGGATLLIGFLFHTFFSIDISEWGWIPNWMRKIFVPKEIAGYDGTMVLALAVGVVHISLALVVKAVYATKKSGFLNSLGTWGWTLLIVGGVIVAAFALAGVIDAALTKWIVIALGSISAAGIFLLNDIHRNPLLNIGSGLWETYNTATGLLGDVLSYLRLYALGLAGAMLGFAFNDLGRMVLGDGGGALAWVFFILIVVIGHTLNLAMAALGAFVHPLRLNFLEFFKNSGYEGAGRNYHPLQKTITE